MAKGIAPRAESTAATVDQVVFRNGENGGINKPVKVAFRSNVEFVDADVEAIVIDRKVRKSGTRGPP